MNVWGLTKKDTGSVKHKALERVRQQAVARVLAGHSPSMVAKSLGIGRSSINRWLRAYKKGGRQALKSTVAQGSLPKLNQRRKQQVRRWVIGNAPSKYGFNGGLWTRNIIAEMISYHFGVSLSVASIGTMLASLGVMPPNPLRKANGPGQKAVMKWKKEEYPALRRQARHRQADILFLSVVSAREKNAVSVVSTKGAFLYKLCRGPLTAGFLVTLLNEVLNECKRPVMLIVDESPVCRAKKAADFVRKNQGRLEMFFLPRNALEGPRGATGHPTGELPTTTQTPPEETYLR